jgi:hypothetical protein
LARAERERVKKDAARWRWWRKWWADDADDLERINDVQSVSTTAEELDAAVDVAIRASVGGGAKP